MTSLASPPVRLQLYLGPAVPLPAPQFVLDALEEVTVESGSGATQSGFELVFSLPKNSPLHTLFLLAGSSPVPILRVVIAVTIAGSTEILMDGVATHHDVSHGGAGPQLKVKGKDLTAVMDIIPLDGVPYPAMPPALRALTALAKYAALGCVPLVIPSVVEDVPIPIERIPRHQGTDYGYLKALAEDVGYVFYTEPGAAVGMSTAYWGPEIRVGAPQPALTSGFGGAQDNVTSLSFAFDKEKSVLPIVYVQETYSKAPIPIPIPPVSPVNPPLGAVPPLPIGLHHLRDTAGLNPAAAVMRGIGYAAKNSDAVTATGSLDLARYGRVLRSRRLVGVRGAGDPFNGLYYVSSVTHALKRGSYTTNFSLARNGFLPTVPKVPT